MSEASSPAVGGNPAAPVTRVRPSTVSIAGYLLFLTAGLQAVNALLGVTIIGRTRRIFREAYAGTAAEGIESLMVGTVVVSVVVSLLLAAGVVVLAVLNNQGRNPARIVTWVVGGLAVCCTGLGLVNSGLTSAMNTGGTGGDLPDPADVQRRVEEALPSWYTPVTTTLGVLSLLSLLTALILLALPASNEFFRKPRPVWQPPMPGATWPGHPQYGPGQQQYPYLHPAQPAPGHPAPPAQQPGGSVHPAPQAGPAQPAPEPPGSDRPGESSRPADGGSRDGTDG